MRTRFERVALLVVVGVAATALCGCAGPAKSADAPPPSGDGSAGAATGAAGGVAAAPRAKGRTQLWAENCQRCHNARPASWYGEREWEVAMHHMFVRGYLTRRENDSIMEFFRAAR